MVYTQAASSGSRETSPGKMTQDEPTLVVVYGVTGPLEMAEKKWVIGGITNMNGNR